MKSEQARYPLARVFAQPQLSNYSAHIPYPVFWFPQHDSSFVLVKQNVPIIYLRQSFKIDLFGLIAEIWHVHGAYLKNEAKFKKLSLNDLLK